MKLLILCSLIALSPANAIDFQLRELAVRSGEGTSTDLYFANEGSRIFYRPPPQWKWQGDAERFEATPPGGRWGTLSFAARAPLPETGAFGSEENLAKLAAAALAELPANVQDAGVSSTTLDRLGGREVPAVRMVVDYRHDSIARTRIVCFIQFRTSLWIEIRLDSPRADSPRNVAEVFHSLEAFTEVATASAATARAK